MELNLQTAELALREASESNPGAWADHSRFVAEACKNIASQCKDLSSEQAYIFGLLHDKEINAEYYFSDYGDKVAT